MAIIDKTYHDLLNEILKKGFKYEDPNRKGVHRIQIPTYTFKHDFADGFPAVTTKKLYWKGVVGELLWILKGDTNIKYLVDNGINIWNKDAYNYYLKQYPKIHLKYKDWLEEIGNVQTIGNLGRVYGAQWRDFTDGYNQYSGIDEGIDQISNLLKGLKENPMGTKHIVTTWNPAELNDMALPPCHWSFEILVEPLTMTERINLWGNNTKNIIFKESKIKTEFLNSIQIPEYKFTLKWHQRSVDSFLGGPFNVASYALLAHIIGKMTNMIPKGIIGDLSNVHIYEPHLDAVKEQLSRSTNFHNSRCELLMDYDVEEMLKAYHYQGEYPLDKVLSLIEIKDFTLSDHTEQSAIKAEMLAYNK